MATQGSQNSGFKSLKVEKKNILKLYMTDRVTKLETDAAENDKLL